MKEEKVKITGMTCSACANRVQKVVGKLDGVEEANVNFATETLNVKYDNDKINNSDIESAIEKKVKITGMTCSACANRVERVTKKVSGVENSSVNFATEKLNITFDENKISVNELKSIVEKAGYNLIVEGKKEDAVKKIPDFKKLWYRFILSLIFLLISF